MYEYKFLEINSKLGLSSHFKGYEEIIKEQALEGWRFVTAIPAKTQGLEGITVLSIAYVIKNNTYFLNLIIISITLFGRPQVAPTY